MNAQQLHSRLRTAGLAGVGELVATSCDPYVAVAADGLLAVLAFLRDDPETGMEMLHNVTAIEREGGFDIAYHLCSYTRRHSLTLKVELARPAQEAAETWQPSVPSACGVYASANWHEREQWDLLGVHFTGHPDLRRILLPEEWIGHPLRKSYVYPTAHGEIPLTLDAIPIYERDPSQPVAVGEPRPAGTPLPQPPSQRSRRPDAGGRAPEGSVGTDPHKEGGH